MENLTESKGEIDKCTITVGYFNTLVFTSRSGKKKICRDIDINNDIGQIGIIDT